MQKVYLHFINNINISRHKVFIASYKVYRFQRGDRQKHDLKNELLLILHLKSFTFTEIDPPSCNEITCSLNRQSPYHVLLLFIFVQN